MQEVGRELRRENEFYFFLFTDWFVYRFFRMKRIVVLDPPVDEFHRGKNPDVLRKEGIHKVYLVCAFQCFGTID